MAGKLVRDRIPEIIRANGEEPITYRAEPDEYRRRLRDKLVEEVDEFLTDGDPLEELADVLEVVYALAADLGADEARLDQIRDQKAAKRGRFAEQIVWVGVK